MDSNKCFYNVALSCHIVLKEMHCFTLPTMSSTRFEPRPFFDPCRLSTDLRYTAPLLLWARDGNVPLLRASLKGDLAEARQEIVPDVTLFDLAFLAAAMNGQTQALQEMISHGRRIQVSVWYASEALIQAAERDELPMVRLLLGKTRADPSHKDNACLLHAVRNGNEEMVKMLLREDRVDAGDRDNESLIVAAEKGHFQVFKILLENEQVDASARGEEALWRALLHGHDEIVSLLLQRPMEPSIRARTWAKMEAVQRRLCMLLEEKIKDV
jgi:hypothetical protein